MKWISIKKTYWFSLDRIPFKRVSHRKILLKEEKVFNREQVQLVETIP